MTTGRIDDAGPDHGGVVPFPRRGVDARAATVSWSAPPWLRAPAATGSRATLLAVRPDVRVRRLSGSVPAPAAELVEPGPGRSTDAPTSPEPADCPPPAPTDDRPDGTPPDERPLPYGDAAAPAPGPRTVAEAAALRWPTPEPQRTGEDTHRSERPRCAAADNGTAADGPSTTDTATTGDDAVPDTAVLDYPANDDPANDEPVLDDATGDATGDDRPAPPVRYRPTPAAVDHTPRRARHDIVTPRPREPEPPPVPLLPRPRPAPDHRPAGVLVPGRGGLGPARPRVVEETGILGLSRLTRGRVGSRLFTLFFVAVFALIFVQMVVTLVHG